MGKAARRFRSGEFPTRTGKQARLHGTAAKPTTRTA